MLELVCLVVINQNSNYHKVAILNSSNYITGSIYTFSHNMSEYFNLKEINQELAEENALLRAELKRSKYNNHFTMKMEQTRDYEKQLYTYIPAKIISKTIHKRDNYFTINKGKAHTLKTGMGVICSQGVVGVIISVSEYYATVLSLLHTSSRVSVKIKKNNYFGIMSRKENTTQTMLLQDIPQSVDIQKGDTIISSGYSSFYPANTPIGAISDYAQPEGSNFYNIEIDLFLSFQQVEDVYVVNNIMGEELKIFESLGNE